MIGVNNNFFLIILFLSLSVSAIDFSNYNYDDFSKFKHFSKYDFILKSQADCSKNTVYYGGQCVPLERMKIISIKDTINGFHGAVSIGQANNNPGTLTSDGPGGFNWFWWSNNPVSSQSRYGDSWIGYDNDDYYGKRFVVVEVREDFPGGEITLVADILKQDELLLNQEVTIYLPEINLGDGNLRPCRAQDCSPILGKVILLVDQFGSTYFFPIVEGWVTYNDGREVYERYYLPWEQTLIISNIARSAFE